MASHTATGEWKSFEIRMRRRRAQRLLLRADIAAETGCLEEARASLDEARALCPHMPRLAEVQRKIEAAASPVDAPVDTPSRWKELTAAVATFLFVAGATYVIVLSQQSRTPAAPETPAIVNAIAAPPPEAVPSDVSSLPPERETTAEPEPIAAPREDPPLTFAPVAPVATSGAAGRPRSEPIGLVPVSPEFALPTPATAITVPVPVAPKAEAAQPSQESLVRSALARYAQAYSDLDVDAAARVWPSVSRDALTRAFDSLESQQVTLGDCRIQVDGVSAHATCSGSARWTPKVGREQTDARRWSFDLEQSADGWQITSARVQNR